MNWAENIFKKNARIFLELMNLKWEVAKKEATSIVKILKRYKIHNGNILDVMCGNGRIGLNLSKFGYRVTGIDFSESFISDAKRRAHIMGVEDRVRFICSNVDSIYTILNSNEKFKAILLVWTSIGYYGKNFDFRLFQDLKKLADHNGLLLIIDTLSKEYIKASLPQLSIFETDNFRVYSNYFYNAATSKLTIKWTFFRKSGFTERYHDSCFMEIYLYSYPELESILKRAGWTILEEFDNASEFSRRKNSSMINIVAIAKK
ncbi:MAG: class I SAM-dependent methyltransferase [Candidatus Njordarchaeales archaeon]